MPSWSVRERERLRENLYSLCAASLTTIYILGRCYAFFGAALDAGLRFRNFGLLVLGFEAFQEKISDSQVELVYICIQVVLYKNARILKPVLVR